MIIILLIIKIIQNYISLIIKDIYIVKFLEIKKHSKKEKYSFEKTRNIKENARIKVKKCNNFNKIKNRFLLMALFNFVIILNLFFQRSIENKFCFLENSISKISLKVKGTGNQIILGHGYDNGQQYFAEENYPNEIRINGVNQSKPFRYQYDLQQEINYVELIWYENVKSARCMFHGGSAITEIDFTDFNTSEIESMEYLFRKCSSLTSINFGKNFDTSKVTEMSLMFCNCAKLTSLNLSTFNTSKITYMHNMFNGCESLTSLDLSSFDTSHITNINSFFIGCSSLSSLNLQNFDFTAMQEVMNFFNGCSNLEYINLKNFDKNKITVYNNIFTGVPNNVVICLNEEKIQNKILSKIEQKSCYVIDCSDDWKSKQKKIKASGTCSQNCSDDSLYEYNGECLETCLFLHGQEEDCCLHPCISRTHFCCG